jgi:hypothetical protein
MDYAFKGFEISLGWPYGLALQCPWIVGLPAHLMESMQ